jgi:hypothetical protein
MSLLNANIFCLQIYAQRFLKALLFGTTKIALDSIFIIGRASVNFSQAICSQTKNFSRFLLRMSTTNAAWLLLERIVQIVVYGTLMPLEGAGTID